MRSPGLALAVSLLMVVAVPPAGAQDDMGLLVLEDPSSDQDVYVAGSEAGGPSGRFAAGDLRALHVKEQSDVFVFRLSVENLGNSPETPFETILFSVGFAHGGMAYRVLFWRQPGQSPEYGGQLQVYDPGQDDYGGGQRLTVTANPASNSMETAVPRDSLLDENGAAPFPGRQLTGFQVTSSAAGFGDNQLGCFFVVPCIDVPRTTVTDAMPNSGVGEVPVPVTLGLVQTGYARLAADTPVRASNGEATTFLYEVTAANLDPNKHRFALGATGVPASWQIHLPSDLIELEANAQSVLPILVTTPFGHNHGSFEQFLVEMTSLDDPGSVGRIQLGVRYMATPQPAGHHNALYLHTTKPTGDATFDDLAGTVFGFDPQRLYFNTLQDDENDAKEPVGGSYVNGFDFPPSTNVPTGRYTWSVPLSPQLAMGLDFDMAATGSIRVLVDSVMPLPGAVLSGRIFHTVPQPCQGEECPQQGQGGGRNSGIRTNVADLQPSAPVEVGANSVGKALESVIVATPAGDYVPFSDGATLTLQLNLTFERPEVPFGPHDTPKVSGGSMTLPLLEYHDPVNQVFSSMAGLMIHVEGAQQRLANAGDTVVFDLSLMNHGDKDASYDLELDGAGLDWARTLGDRHVVVAAGQTRPLAIAVAVPKEAEEGKVADIILTAVDANDPTQRTLARLVVVVDEGADHPDDSSRVAELEEDLTANKAPGLPLSAALLALAALAIGRRRRLA